MEILLSYKLPVLRHWDCRCGVVRALESRGGVDLHGEAQGNRLDRRRHFRGRNDELPRRSFLGRDPTSVDICCDVGSDRGGVVCGGGVWVVAAEGGIEESASNVDLL